MPIQYEKVKHERLLIDLSDRTNGSTEQCADFFQKLVPLVCTRYLRKKIEREIGFAVKNGTSDWLTVNFLNSALCVFSSSRNNDAMFGENNPLPLTEAVEKCMHSDESMMFRIGLIASNFSICFRGESKFEISFHLGHRWSEPDSFIHSALEKVLKEGM